MPRFTRPDGSPFLVANPGDVADVSPASRDLDPHGSNAVIVFGNGQRQAVRESFDDVARKLGVT